MLGTYLTEDGQIGADSQIVGHADFLATGYPHAVYPADGRFFTVQDSINHTIEQIHVIAVFLGPHGIVFSIFFGISTGTKSHIAHAAKYTGRHPP